MFTSTEKKKVSLYPIMIFFLTGNEEDDVDVRQAVLELLTVIQSFNNHFNESQMFQGDSVESNQLKVSVFNPFISICLYSEGRT